MTFLEEEEKEGSNGSKRIKLSRSRSEFAGIRKNSSFARLIEKSFTNQTMTLAKTVEEAETFMFQCVYCRVVMVEVKGDWDCSHCGGSMRMTAEPGDQEESEP